MSFHNLVGWVAAGLLAGLGVMVISIVTFDEITHYPLDPTVLALLTLLLGIIGTILGVNTAGNLYTAAQTQTVAQVRQIQNGVTGHADSQASPSSAQGGTPQGQ
jgi:hypothetical protein